MEGYLPIAFEYALSDVAVETLDFEVRGYPKTGIGVNRCFSHVLAFSSPDRKGVPRHVERDFPSEALWLGPDG